MTARTIRIGTRGSKLALAQSQWVRRKIEEKRAEWRVEIIPLATMGDRLLNLPLTAATGKGVFVKEIEEALLRGEIDLAVHSLKDLPTEFPPGLALAAIPERENPFDVLISRAGLGLKELPAGAQIGTGSFRRQAQLLHCRPDLTFVPIRGNVDTRLKKLDTGDMDGLVMAEAGLRRLGWEGRVTEILPPEVCVSAAGQGAIGIEGREGEALISEASFLNHAPTAAEVAAERAFLKRLGGGCQTPIGALARVDGDDLRMIGVVADRTGTRLFRGEISGTRDRGEGLGEALAERLLDRGAGDLLLAGGKEDVPPGSA
jgi:hydroxymethylbilane synthase